MTETQIFSPPERVELYMARTDAQLDELSERERKKFLTLLLNGWIDRYGRLNREGIVDAPGGTVLLEYFLKIIAGLSFRLYGGSK